jgi:hypothetical protein
VVIGGATIRVAEHSRLRATTRPDGSYELAVPDRATVTPYISAAGYHKVLVTAHAYNGKLVRWRLRRATPPRAVTLCLPLGNTKAQPRC